MNQTALITGASGGLGLEFSRIFAREGYDLVLVARSEDKLQSLKQELEQAGKIKATVLAIDLTQPNAADEVFQFTEQQQLTISALVNNAGFADFGAFAQCDWAKQAGMVQLNITTLMQLTRHYLPQMIERKSGKILNIASIAAFEPGPLMSVYYASKAFVLSFTEALSVEIKGTGVSITALCPGPTKTGFEARANLGASGLFKNLKNATAQDVAAFGYRNLTKGKVVAIPGVMNKLITLGGRMMPKALVRNVVYRIQK
ncbi:SDR family oxidoreductase [Eubacteriales bacterium OttesenSCG-928-N13]|nr:SDR family oxidoreductase [Eubacteriales bacterium OttesenSCG-928-N13]